MKTLALFDFDGTLYKKDSLIGFTKYYKGNAVFYKGILTLLPFLLGMKLGILFNEKTKKRYMTHFFKNEEYSVFKKKAELFALTKIEKDLNPQILLYLKNHLNSKHDVYIVTASFPEWIEPWSKKYNIKVIGTRLEVLNNIITGEFNSKNCYGKEKVNRINEVLDLEKFDTIYVYGCGKGDREMLELKK
ncbi:HAD-IB family hydrolase [Flavobacterium gyeonganense]|uniref:HAD-IB family hydrolase n=1 Tax=Flavobacterium gyeonganense TaxID=1310418 RepID=A0ABV5HA99_9FLAO|nr:HAD-IB family hydrolase [Flavobacterium gyeonganense]